MNAIKNAFTNLGKILLCSLAFIIGAVIGSMAATLMGLNQPSPPAGVDSSSAFLFLSLESPIVALTLVFLVRGLGGRLSVRAFAISFFTWVTFTLNTVVESLAFTTTTVEGAVFTAVSFLFPCIFIGVSVARLFSTGDKAETITTLVEKFFSRRTTGAWVWRIAVAFVAFAPIYLLFGSLVAPITSRYFQQNMFGLKQPTQNEIFLVLLIRSLLFLLACLPIIVLWRRSRLNLFVSLGFALFVLVGFLYMLGAYYMPLVIRIPHTLEILADSFAYAGILVSLLVKGGRPLNQRTMKPAF